MCLLAIYLFSFVNCLFKSFPHYSNWSIFLFNIYFIFNFCFLHILFYLKILTYLKVVKVLFLLEAIWFWLLPLGLESIIIIIIIWNKVGSRVHSTPPHPAHSYTVFSALRTENTFLSPPCLGTFLKNQQEWSISGPSFYSTDVCYIHIILVLFFLIIPLICFLFSPMIYSLTRALFGGLLLNFQPFWDLLDVTVLLVHTILVREHILYVSVL